MYQTSWIFSNVTNTSSCHNHRQHSYNIVSNTKHYTTTTTTTTLFASVDKTETSRSVTRDWSDGDHGWWRRRSSPSHCWRFYWECHHCFMSTGKASTLKYSWCQRRPTSSWYEINDFLLTDIKKSKHVLLFCLNRLA